MRVANVAEYAVFVIRLEKLEFHDFMPKEYAHERMAQFVHGRSQKSRRKTNAAVVVYQTVKIAIDKGNNKPDQENNSEKVKKLR